MRITIRHPKYWCLIKRQTKTWLMQSEPRINKNLTRSLIAVTFWFFKWRGTIRIWPNYCSPCQVIITFEVHHCGRSPSLTGLICLLAPNIFHHYSLRPQANNLALPLFNDDSTRCLLLFSCDFYFANQIFILGRTVLVFQSFISEINLTDLNLYSDRSDITCNLKCQSPKGLKSLCVSSLISCAIYRFYHHQLNVTKWIYFMEEKLDGGWLLTTWTFGVTHDNEDWYFVLKGKFSSGTEF